MDDGKKNLISGHNNYLTIDVEDYYQVAAFEKIVDTEQWQSFESRVEKNTNRILEILDIYRVSATFFVLGWVAEHFPRIVKEIFSNGHQIGCHSYLHRKIYTLTPKEFREDTQKAKIILEDLTGSQIKGYRAPSFSITRKSLWALEILGELGFTYDSSVFPIIHDNYGIPDAPRFQYEHEAAGLIEYPISTALVAGRKIPISGGGYFRIFPYWFTRYALQTINKKEGQPFVFYLHPWELDPEQPRFQNASLRSRFRHYLNLNATEARFKRLLQDFKFGPLPNEQ